MSDPKPPNTFLEGEGDDFDWDAALDEREHKAFSRDDEKASAEQEPNAKAAATPTIKPEATPEPTRTIDAADLKARAAPEGRSKGGLGQLFGRNLEPTAILGGASADAFAPDKRAPREAREGHEKNESAEPSSITRETTISPTETSVVTRTPAAPDARGARPDLRTTQERDEFDAFAETFGVVSAPPTAVAQGEAPTAPPPAMLPTPVPQPTMVRTPPPAPVNKPAFDVPEFEFDREDARQLPRLHERLQRFLEGLLHSPLCRHDK